MGLALEVDRLDRHAKVGPQALERERHQRRALVGGRAARGVREDDRAARLPSVRPLERRLGGRIAAHEAHARIAHEHVRHDLVGQLVHQDDGGGAARRTEGVEDAVGVLAPAADDEMALRVNGVQAAALPDPLRHEDRCECGGETRQQSRTADHEQNGREATACRRRGEIAVPDGRHRDDPVPERVAEGADVAVARRFESEDDGRPDDEHRGGCAGEQRDPLLAQHEPERAQAPALSSRSDASHARTPAPGVGASPPVPGSTDLSRPPDFTKSSCSIASASSRRPAVSAPRASS